ncbi:HAMP domain-containing sensor histidine kinase [Nonomuraea jiangxiensis]|uniref:Oxygen sensor histidine kinase NreB n=1 Tax=Nonomuraea jiangxiensis TaxID=633440 RepID=A0A1G9E330_9ACTN|nr:ATP-binding protein [Nonomuraea jiangxiensis]SDK70556.1 Histidine kinase-, DNA gyrase B-, and HSP90-like ATPase [Nonomuraea jiangxiensis]
MSRFGLRARMAASYVLVTATAVLLVEAVVVGLYLIPQANAVDLAAVLQEQASKDAKMLSLEVARVSAAGPGRSPSELLAAAAPGRSTLVGGARPPEPGYAMLEALVDTGGVIVAGSAPGLYAAGDRLDVPLPGPDGGGGSSRTRTGPSTWHFSPVLGRNLEILGYVYVQAPAQTVVNAPTAESVAGLLAPGLLVLALAIPVGLVFGLLSTRRLTSRVRELANVTTAVAAGDFRPRVPVTGNDEVSVLERSFNVMTDRLGTAVEAARLAARTEARQSERGRIARELHDSISQDLFSLSLLAGGMRRAAPESLRAQAASMERTAARAMREMRALLLELRPVALEDAGLLLALEELCNAYRTRLGVRVEADLADVTLSPQAEHAVLRLVQEALGNAVKHADPTRVEVRLSQDGGPVTVEVADNGRGFDPAGVAGRHGMGLALMRERVTELGGRWEIHSDGSGTTVRASLP